jgi:hypothetical protein
VTSNLASLTLRKQLYSLLNFRKRELAYWNWRSVVSSQRFDAGVRASWPVVFGRNIRNRSGNRSPKGRPSSICPGVSFILQPDFTPQMVSFCHAATGGWSASDLAADDRVCGTYRGVYVACIHVWRLCEFQGAMMSARSWATLLFIFGACRTGLDFKYEPGGRNRSRDREIAAGRIQPHRPLGSRARSGSVGPANGRRLPIEPAGLPLRRRGRGIEAGPPSRLAFG